LTTGAAYMSGSTMYCTDFGVSSDLRLKDLQENLRYETWKLDYINGVRYKWNDLGVSLGRDPNTLEVGVIAQEVQAVLPEAVTTDKDGYLIVKYDRLVPLLIEVVKQLNERVRVLELKG
jgi:hypothetical protein